MAFNGTGPTAVVRTPTAEPRRHAQGAEADRRSRASLPSFKKGLTLLGLKISSDKAVVENLSEDVIRVRLARTDGKDDKAKPKPDPKAKPVPETPKAIDVLYFVNKDGLFAAAGYDPKDSLRGLAKAKAGGNLRGNAPMAQALAAAGDDVALVVLTGRRCASSR